jgi:energy-coupling factor transporter ATP-binding protein EcfA2
VVGIRELTPNAYAGSSEGQLSMKTPDRPRIILLFGPSGSGKSTLARLLAGRLPRCACIEVDTLRYMVVGGLVAHSGGMSPEQAPEEYSRQCWLGVANAVRLAEGFTAAGFSSVIEGLEDECRPGTGWIERTFPDAEVCSVAVVCSEAVLSERWRQRGWDGELSSGAMADLRWYRENGSLFAGLVDTTGHSAEEDAEFMHNICKYY